MNEACEITIIIKDNEKSLRKKFLVYESESVLISANDPVIKDCINETLKNFDGEPEDVKVKITLQI